MGICGLTADTLAWSASASAAGNMKGTAVPFSIIDLVKVVEAQANVEQNLEVFRIFSLHAANHQHLSSVSSGVSPPDYASS